MNPQTLLSKSEPVAMLDLNSINPLGLTTHHTKVIDNRPSSPRFTRIISYPIRLFNLT